MQQQQHGYGVPEIQQFMVDGSSFLSISHDINTNSHKKHHLFHQHNTPAPILPFLGNLTPVLTQSSSREPITDEPTFGEVHSIKGPVWKFADMDCSNKVTKSCKDKLFKKGEEKNEEEQHERKNRTSYGLFGELEAIYSCSSKLGVSVDDPHIDLGSEACLKKTQPKNKKRKRKQWKKPICVFFKSLVNQLIDHQDGFHRKFLEITERRDQDRINREEAWRREEINRLDRETAIRKQEQDLCLSRERTIVSFLEKITGETMFLPPRQGFVETHKQEEEEEREQEKPTETGEDQYDNSINVDSNSKITSCKDGNGYHLELTKGGVNVDEGDDGIYEREKQGKEQLL